MNDATQELSAVRGWPFSEALRAYERTVQTLLEAVPRVPAKYAGVSDPSGWQAMEVRYRAFAACRQLGLNPPLVVTMFGPSGAGKSSLFRRLTGINVPVSEIRPTTYHCVVAVPLSLCQEELLRLVFPGLRLTRLENPEDVRQKDPRSPQLFYSPMTAGNGDLPFILADVPDFNTVECENWARAEDMLRRAELTIFVSYSESYKDKKTIEMLARCCQLSELLVYVLTKTVRRSAQNIWRDLVASVETYEEFRSTRNDGRTLAEFLASSLCYYSPPVAPDQAPRFITVEPLYEGQPGFLELLRGQPAEQLVAGALAQSVSAALPYCREVLRKGQAKLQGLQSSIRTCEEMLRGVVEEVVKEVYPLGAVLEEVKRVAFRRVPAPFRWLGEVGKLGLFIPRSTLGAFNGLGRLVSTGDTTGAEEQQVVAQQLDLLEQEKLRQGLERLINQLRERFPNTDGDEPWILSSERCHTVLNNVFRDPWPAPSDDWKAEFLSEIEAWIRQHVFWAVAIVVSPFLTLTGLGLIAVDLVTTGGFFGTTLGTLTAVGAASSMGELLSKLQLQRVAEKAFRSWVKHRSRELYSHLDPHFLRPLLEPWLNESQTLEGIAFDDALAACDQMDELARHLRSSIGQFSQGLER